jgi:hypothetical protein
MVYGLLFYLAPLAGLIGTFAADRSHRRIIFVYACASTAVLCPLVFGFPTEMWMAHALFWPALAVAHYANRTFAGTALVFAMLLLLAFAHEGALVLTVVIVATLGLRGWRDGSFQRAAAVLIVVLALAAASKFVLPPDEYYAGVLMRAALHFFDLTIFQVGVVMLLFAVFAGYGISLLLLSRLTQRAWLYAAVIVVVALSIYWLWFDHRILASNRYYLRTALVIVTPVFGALGAWSAMSGDGRLALALPGLDRAMTAARSRAAGPLAALFVIVTLVHVIETAKFVAAWSHYRAAVASLATGDASDPALGDPHFVSTERIAPDLKPLSWFSTTPYLSVLVAGFTPNRLVIDPAGNYFWLSCATATANAQAVHAVPQATRDLVRIYSCLHR